MLFDELETAGRRFLSPKDRAFTPRAQRGSTQGESIFEVELACKPRLSEAELGALVERLAKLVPPEAPSPEPVEPPPFEEDAPVKTPWWRIW